MSPHLLRTVFFFNDTATTEIYTLSLHDALPISTARPAPAREKRPPTRDSVLVRYEPSWCRRSRERSSPRKTAGRRDSDRKSTRLNSSHANISYAVFCLKKKKHNPLTVQQTISFD